MLGVHGIVGIWVPTQVNGHGRCCCHMQQQPNRLPARLKEGLPWSSTVFDAVRQDRVVVGGVGGASSAVSA